MRIRNLKRRKRHNAKRPKNRKPQLRGPANKVILKSKPLSSFTDSFNIRKLDSGSRITKLKNLLQLGLSRFLQHAASHVDDGQALHFTIRHTERDIERMVNTLEQYLPGISESTSALTAKRRSLATLIISIGKEDVEEIYVELQSHKGGVWVKSYLAGNKDRKILIERLNKMKIPPSTI